MNVEKPWKNHEVVNNSDGQEVRQLLSHLEIVPVVPHKAVAEVSKIGNL